MKFVRLVVALIGVSALSSTGPAGAGDSGPLWLGARHATLPSGAKGLGQGYLPSLSCPSNGNCAATGVYLSSSGQPKGLILNEVNGVWRQPTTIVAPANAASAPGLTPYGVSCASVGNCTAAGSYQDVNSSADAFVANEVNGAWRRAQEVTLPAGANQGAQNAQVRALACERAGFCSAVGTFLDTTSPMAHVVGFVIDEVNGAWRRAQEVTLPAGANANPFVNLTQVACASVDECAATGWYVDANNVTHGLIVNRVHGVWRDAQSLTPPTNASAYPNTQVSALTCARAGYCSAIGTYLNAVGMSEGFSVDERAGRWGRALTLRLPVRATVNPHVFFYGFDAISCASVGNCSVGGQFRDNNAQYQGFFVNEVHGVWRDAQPLALPSDAAMAGKNGGVVAVSCVANGTCSAGAAYFDRAGLYQALIVNEVHGVWQRGAKVALPGGATSVGIDGGVYAVVCHAGNHCTASGSYLATPSSYAGFTVATR